MDDIEEKETKKPEEQSSNVAVQEKDINTEVEQQEKTEEETKVEEQPIEIKEEAVVQNIRTEAEQEKEERKYNNYEKQENPKSKIGYIILSIILILIIGVVIFVGVTVVQNQKNEKIYEGIKINNTSVSGLSKEEAQELILNKCLDHISKEINLKFGNSETNIELKPFITSYNVSEFVEKAYNIGREGNLISQNIEIWKVKKEGRNLEVTSTINEEELIKTVENIITNSSEYVVQPSYYVEGKKLIITSGKKGIALNKEKFLERIYKAVNNIEEEIGAIEIPVETIEPEAINIDNIYNEVHKEVKDAYFTQNPFTIHPEVEGVNFDVEAAKQLIAEPKEQYEIALTITKPKVTTKDIGTEAFPNLLGQFSTKYNAGDKDRTTNLQLAANKINGTVLLPGEEFSYNNVVGERTVAAGYKEAATFSNGKVVDGLGGGICQISSTLYDAVVFANLKVTTRRNHQFVPSYVGGGRDATVVWGSQDFKFVNTRKYPIKINATVKGGVAEVLIYGMKEENEYDISIETKQVSTIKYTTKYIDTATLPTGKQRVIQKGENGKVVEAYKVMKQNGKEVSRTLLSKDTYIAKQEIIERGK